jgi:hypothetical protein
MARGSMQEISPWRRNALTIPPDSLQAWMRLAAWEIWMGMLLSVVLGFGVSLIATSPDLIFSVSDLSRCYAPPPIALPCERIAYRGGMMNAAFSTLCGVMLLGVAAWFLWELWSAVEPKPITDDFLKLLNDSFGRDWRNPFTWPWARVFWAYGFTAIGAAATAAIVLTVWSAMTSNLSAKAPAPRVETSQTFRVGK